LKPLLLFLFLTSFHLRVVSWSQWAPNSTSSAARWTTYPSCRLQHHLSRSPKTFRPRRCAQRTQTVCPSVPGDNPTVCVFTSSKLTWVTWCRSSCRTSVSSSTTQTH
jgi:hypothetical protein